MSYILSHAHKYASTEAACLRWPDALVELSASIRRPSDDSWLRGAADAAATTDYLKAISPRVGCLEVMSPQICSDIPPAPAPRGRECRPLSSAETQP